MARDSTSAALREIRALYALGPVGGMSDDQLIGRFLGRGEGGEEAFAALVRRHGPMVLGVCRRMLGGSDADDAFQAVFLVLARKAGSIRCREGLKPWLHGVAVRTSKASRRRRARLRAREGAAIDVARVASATSEDRDELRARLDEELGRLPARFREALVLCELEGASRRDAAARLGIAEGTLSSRLARGRALLRDRLARRGVALGAGSLAALLGWPAAAAVPGPLLDATARLALSFTARSAAAAGSVPTAVASLAEGVLTMIAHAHRTATLAALALGAVGLTVAWSAVPRLAEPDDPRPAAVAEVAKAKPVEEPARPTTPVRGTVVDEAGRPVAGAEVVVDPFTDREARGVTAVDGSFAVPARRAAIASVPLLARSADGDRLGVFRYESDRVKGAYRGPARVVLKPGRDVDVRVADAKGVPVSVAEVEAFGGYVVAGARTGPDGHARLRLPVDARIACLIALRSGVGFDYAEFGPLNGNGHPRDGAPAAEIPASVALVLDGARTARIKAVDAAGRPRAGIGFAPWMIQKEGRRSFANLPASRIFVATTGPDGVATFDWLPPAKETLTFWPRAEGFAHRRVSLEDRADGATVVARLDRPGTIRGRVVRPDGSPASGVDVVAWGSGRGPVRLGQDHGRGAARTDADGSYEMAVDSGEAYIVSVKADDGAAPARFGVVVREGRPSSGVDFRLALGAVLRGTVTFDPGDRPAPGQYVGLVEDGGPVPAEAREPDEPHARMQSSFGATTDAKGRYAIRVAPGTYTMSGPAGGETITIQGDAELVRDFRVPRVARKVAISGRVVLASEPGRGVAGAKVELMATNIAAIVPVVAWTDAEGRFRAERDPVRLVVHAQTLDGSLGAIVDVGTDEAEVVIPVAPTASAAGLLLDERGQPAANRPLAWGRRVELGPDRDIFLFCFVPRVRTDARGRFALPGLVVGQSYSLAVSGGTNDRPFGDVRPEAPGPIDLGTYRIDVYRPGPGEVERERAGAESSFQEDAPGPGKPAPAIAATDLDGKPLALADFRGKYVLLDFWATWCGPCLGEIPNLQAIHDAFGKDARFAILSVSLDETIAEPKAFQAKRKLPWNQAFLSGGLHNPTTDAFGLRAIPGLVLVGPDGTIVARGMRGDAIREEVAKALGTP